MFRNLNVILNYQIIIDDLSIAKQYRDQFSDDFVSVGLFPKIRTKDLEEINSS